MSVGYLLCVVYCLPGSPKHNKKAFHQCFVRVSCFTTGCVDMDKFSESQAKSTAVGAAGHSSRGFCACCFVAADTYYDSRSWSKCVKDLRWLRNQVVAPLTEEFVFRACMIPMLVPCTGPTAAIFISPLFFGVAHFHHITEQLRFGQDTVFEILTCAAFQFVYTYIFGAYTAFIFIRTGHLVGPMLCHSFCNQMGFPAIGSVLHHPQKPVVLLSYQLGILLFLILLFPFTDPAFYGMSPICSLLLTRSACA
ncbi:CAAX prenyl protease 2 [Labeo rohita]|uniref:CAAX prenyl protease 2 n=1 Tax=Labeo rohita TaxID=84645 RepID=A0ABQ8LKW3_LABRO|nr:CAAX prenyl protease 2 [Labeo rohita]